MVHALGQRDTLCCMERRPEIKIEALQKDYEPCDYIVTGMEVKSSSATRAFVQVQVTETCKPRIMATTRQLEASRAFELEETADGRWIVPRGP